MRSGVCLVLAALGFNCAIPATAAPPGQEPAAANAEGQFRQLLDAYVGRFQPLYVQAETAGWEASIAGTDAAFARKEEADKALVELHSNRELFEQLKQLKAGGQISDPLLARQLDVMYRAFLPGQADPALRKRIVELENDVEQTFNTYRAAVGGKTLSENDIRAILVTTTDPAAAEAAWKGYMAVGQKAAGTLRELVKLRNEMARQLGFDNYQSLQLQLQEINHDELMKLFDELDTLTSGPFAELKGRIDGERAAHFGIAVAQLRPWEYGDLFFQEAPPAGGLDMDALFENANLLDIAKRYYDGIDLGVDEILARSSLYEQPGKSPHAFCSDIDRAGDVRVLLNLKPNAYWADTILHELGHAIYDEYLNRELPFLLRSASHGITTEGIAQMFGSMSKNEEWLKTYLQLSAPDAAGVGAVARDALRTEKLVFSRWAQVMVRFEHGMYADPDQDLGKLWWDLKRKYQLLNPPDDTSRPDYAAKVHVITTPVYYHNYLMGELFAAQVKYRITQDVLNGADPRRAAFIGKPQVGEWLRQRVFAPGNLYSWNELTRRATGEPLTPKYFAQEFLK